MAKRSSSVKIRSSISSNPRGAPAFDTPQAPKSEVNRNLIGVSPNSQQFEPTDAMPVRARFKMAGGA